MFKNVYKNFLLPTMQEATELLDEMRKLQSESKRICFLEIDRLKAALNKLQIMIKKLEGECQWESVAVLEDEAMQLKKQTERIKSTMSREGNFTFLLIGFI